MKKNDDLFKNIDRLIIEMVFVQGGSFMMDASSEHAISCWFYSRG